MVWRTDPVLAKAVRNGRKGELLDSAELPARVELSWPVPDVLDDGRRKLSL